MPENLPERRELLEHAPEVAPFSQWAMLKRRSDMLSASREPHGRAGGGGDR